MKYLKTFREMLTKPGNIIDSFVLKKETKFQHPFSFGLMGITVLIILNSILVDFNTSLQSGLMGTENDQISQLNYWIEYVKLKASTQFLPLTMFLLFIPSLTIPGLFFFRDDIEGFYYNLILNSYSLGVSFIALLILIPIWMLDETSIADPSLQNYLPVLLTGAFVIGIYHKYFNIQDVMGWVRIFSSYITGCLIFFLLKSFSAGIIGYFIFAVNRFLDLWMRV